ncbi:MAG: TIGR01777 family oxidoreductase [Verrucomicrobia bacterium]|nr:TIGR01777 family oxidoreductase [Verrucomicrobiota bacterium]
MLGGGFARRKLAAMFAWRQERTKADLELATRYGAVKPMRIVVAGASGMMGQTLVPLLETQGHEVVRLVRRPTTAAGEVFWNPAAGEIDLARLGAVDAVVNLSGENVGAGRWTPARREGILRSRIDTTRTLVKAMTGLARRPAVLVNASAVGFYGERGDEELTEASAIGHGFLPEVCLVWETHAEGAARAGIRTALLRFGVVLSPAGGALAKLLPLFKLGVGGPVGNGRQWMSWVGLDDAVGAIYHALVEPRCTGPINVVAPEAVTNGQFATTLGLVLHRPAVLPVPAGVLRLVFGEMADATLLASTRAAPARLQETGYAFREPTLAGALAAGLGRKPGETLGFSNASGGLR